MAMNHKLSDIGVVGLGVMGLNLAMNMAEHGFLPAGHDLDSARLQLARNAPGGPIRVAGNMSELVSLIRRPRALLLMVPAGPAVDAVARELLPLLSAGDVIIDGGNSHYKDTDLRAINVCKRGIAWLGAGISGGEEGAKHGPSLMFGGEREAYERVRPLFEAIAARARGEYCVAYLGPGSAGHYVKMIHNGIEYALLQLIAESYDLMKRGLGFSDDELHNVYTEWNETELGSYLLEITAQIFSRVDERTGGRLIDVILDEAHQQGTGKWAVEDALDMQVPAPTMDMAVSFRDLSALKSEREAAASVLGAGVRRHIGDRRALVERLRRALYAAEIIAFSQGFSQLRCGARENEFGFSLETVASIWRGGCIIRAKPLDGIKEAFHKKPDLPSLLLDPGFGAEVREREGELREVVTTAAALGVPAPGLMASLAYFDSYRSPWLPANLIQAQRDYFGAHTYERVDMRGTFHTRWEHEGNQEG